jgi:hypothetical protein
MGRKQIVNWTISLGRKEYFKVLHRLFDKLVNYPTICLQYKGNQKGKEGFYPIEVYLSFIQHKRR